MKAKQWFIALVLGVAVLATLEAAHAEVTSSANYAAIVTWTSNSYHPSDFRGKPLATNGSLITLSVVVTNNGKVIDLSHNPILWYLDQDFLDGGVGEIEDQFKVTQTAGGSHFVSVQIQLPDGTTVQGSSNIPIVAYRAVVDAPYPNNLVQNNSTANFSLIPYFFNISSFSNLSFSWDVNGTEHASTGASNALSLSIGNQPSGQSITIKGSIANTNNPYELASAKTTLYVK